MTETLVADRIEPGGSEMPSLSPAQVNLIFATVAIGLLLSALDQTVVSTALPTIVSDLGGAGHLSWVVTSYLLAETVATALAGKFGDLFGRKVVFEVSVGIFIAGSFLCGLSVNLPMLIAMRGFQGIGAGALTVTASALIGDVIPLRDRGKYQGALGAVFGVATVVGPLLGGFFTDDLSWRWVFYINVPIAVVVVVMAARFVPGATSDRRPTIDYLGVLFVALGSVGLTLATSWGGTQYPWGSPAIIGLFAGSVVALVVFVLVELRSAEPILPMRLFTGRVFSTASALSFIVGFAMLGSITFLPTFLQYVTGTSATLSGVRILPMVVGLLATSFGSGTFVGRTGRYRPFPIAGAVVMAAGMFLLSRMDQHTPVALQSLYMLVMGAGIGLVMQILILVVQNTSDYRDLGSATSGVTFFRTLGGSFGAAVMGTIYASRLKTGLPQVIARLGLAGKASGADSSNPSALKKLPPAIHQPIVSVYANALHDVFLYATPVAVLALVLAVSLPQVRMRGTGAEAARQAGGGFAMPDSTDAGAKLEDVLGRVLRKTSPRERAEVVLASSGTGLDQATAWGVLSVYLRRVLLHHDPTQAEIEAHVGLPEGVLSSYYEGLQQRGLIAGSGTDAPLTVTAEGERLMTSVVAAWRAWLLAELRDWLPDGSDTAPDSEELNGAVRRIITRVLVEEQQRVAA